MKGDARLGERGGGASSQENPTLWLRLWLWLPRELGYRPCTVSDAAAPLHPVD